MHARHGRWGRRGLFPDGLDVDGFGVDGFDRSIAGFADGDFARRVDESGVPFWRPLWMAQASPGVKR